MDILAILLSAAFLLVPIISAIALASSLLRHIPVSTPAHRKCEERVSNGLRTMDMKSYVVFDNLILRSSGNTAHTEIDHVVVSPYGIFCIETKSHKGAIYGYRQSKAWRQYLGGQEFGVVNPLRQNVKHIKALEQLLGYNLRAKIHSYAVFPNAEYVKVDGEYYGATIEQVVRNITMHKSRIYNLHECERILKSLAYASSKSDELRQTHVSEVKAYLLELAA